MNEYKYNNKELAKIGLINQLKEINNKNKQITSISILFYNSILINRCNCTPKCNTYRCQKCLTNIVPDISICLNNTHTLKLEQGNNEFIYFNHSHIHTLGDMSFSNSYTTLPLVKDKIYYKDKNIISCNKYLQFFQNILLYLSEFGDYSEEANKRFSFDFYNNETFEDTANKFLGDNLCCQIFYNQLLKSIPTHDTNHFLLKF